MRAVNALKNAEILTVLDLVQKTESEVEKVKNLGEIVGIRVLRIRNEGKRNRRVEIVLSA